MGGVLTERMRCAGIAAAVVGLCCGTVLPAQSVLAAQSVHAQHVPAQPEPARSVPGEGLLVAPTNSGPAADAPPPGPRFRRYKLRFLANRDSAYENWLVVDLIEDTTLLLWKQATTDGAHWWDHPLTSAQACRITQADGGDRLVDCVRATSPGHGEPLRLVLTPEACRETCLISFSWQENGRLEEGLIRLDRTQQPAVIAPLQQEQAGPDHRGWRYRIKLSQGSASLNLQPESWVLVDVTDGTTVRLKHSTNSVNMLTGVSRWWDHPIVASRACPLFADVSHAAAEGSGCLQGSRSAPDQPLTILLPRAASIHDYRFSFNWRENDRMQEGSIIIDRLQRPIPLP